MKLTIATLALFLLSCGPSPFPYSFAIDPAFPPANRNRLLDAMDRWNAVTRPTYRITLWGDNWRAYYEPPPCKDGCLGAERRRRQAIWIEPDMDLLLSEETCLHELGHALGLDHTCVDPASSDPVAPGSPPCAHESRGVMDVHATTATSLDFTDADMAECRRVGACP